MADYRVIQKDSCVGISKILAGMPNALPILFGLIEHQTSQETAKMVYQAGKMFCGDDALSIGLVDEVVSRDDMKKVTHRRLSQLVTTTSHEEKQMRNKGFLDQLAANMDEGMEDFLSLIQSEKAQNVLRENITKSKE